MIPAALTSQPALMSVESRFDWFESAVPIHDLFARSADAEFIFDDESECAWGDLNWRECLVPISAFPARYKFPSILEHVSSLVNEKTLFGNTLAYELERVESIVAWMKSCGGVEPALRRSPLLLTLREGELVVEDGFHRLGVAFHYFGVTEYPALCAECVVSELRPVRDWPNP
jgi:hypothetical protein